MTSNSGAVILLCEVAPRQNSRVTSCSTTRLVLVLDDPSVRQASRSPLAERVVTAGRGARHPLLQEKFAHVRKLSDVVLRRLNGIVAGRRLPVQRMESNGSRLLRTLTAGILCVAVTMGTIAFDQTRTDQTTTNTADVRATSAGESTWANAPASLRAAVAGDLGRSGHHQLGATYTAQGAQFTGSRLLHAGRVSIGRGSHTEQIADNIEHQTLGAAYGSGAFTETFKPTEVGIEQSFQVKRPVTGTGPLVIDVPVTGVIAASNGGSIELRGHSGEVQATYSGLRATDSKGKVLRARMRAQSAGHVIAIKIDDAGAIYPITIDPTWTQVQELTGTGPGTFGTTLAMSGTTAVIGDFEHTLDGNADQGEVYIFTLSGGSWSQTTTLSASDGEANDEFGFSVAISRTTVIVGAPFHEVSGNVQEGAAYIFTLSGGSWTQSAELTPGGAYSRVGYSVAISGNHRCSGCSFLLE